MKHEIKNLKKSELEITITVTKEELDKQYKKALDEASKEVSIKGFRSGHIPAHVLEEELGKTRLLARAQELAIQTSFVEVIIKEKIQSISRPKVTVESQEPFTFKAIVSIMPEVELKDHKSIKVKIETAKATDKELEEILDNIKKQQTTYKTVDEKAKKGDRVEVDFEGFDEAGVSLENTKSKNHPIILGDKMMVPGFEEEIIGLKKDDKKEFDIVFPKDYFKKDFQNKKLKFKIEVKNVEAPETPEITEEVIEKLTGKKQTLDEFKVELKENIQQQKQQENKQKAENEYVEKLIKMVDIEIPESLIHEEVHYIIDEVKENVKQKGLTFEDFLKQTDTTEEQLHEKYEEEAEKRVKARLGLQKAIELEKVVVDEKEISDELEKIKSFYPSEQHDKIQKDYDSGKLKTSIENRLTLRKFFDIVLEK